MPFFFIVGLFLSNNLEYKNFAVKSILFFIFLNILFVGQGIGSDMSARAVYEDSDRSIVSMTSGFWALISVFFPLFINSFLSQKGTYKKILFMIVLLYTLYKLVYAGFATPLALLFINILILVILSFLIKKRNVIDVLRGTIVLVLIATFTVLAFDYLLKADLGALKAVQWRFTNFIENPSGGGYDGNVGVSRIDLMIFSINTFTENLFFGGGGNLRTSMYEGVSGGHSSLFDNLAVFGVFGGGGAFLYFIFISLKNSYKKMKLAPSFDSQCNFAVVLSMIIGGIMNPYWSGSILMCFLLVVNFYKVD